MDIVWTKNIKDPKEKADFENYLKNNRQIFDRIKELLKEKEDSLTQSEISLSSYEKPNWDYRQAHLNGYRSCLASLQKLFDLDRNKETK